ncbi:hypothetical protein SLE2022_378400 [Rubroshorea leprosula]
MTASIPLASANLTALRRTAASAISGVNAILPKQISPFELRTTIAKAAAPEFDENEASTLILMMPCGGLDHDDLFCCVSGWGLGGDANKSLTYYTYFI